jgi:hypothetical protein
MSVGVPGPNVAPRGAQGHARRKAMNPFDLLQLLIDLLTTEDAEEASILVGPEVSPWD